MTIIGSEKSRELIAVNPFGVRENVQLTYACQDCKRNFEPVTIVSAPIKRRALPHTCASAEIIAYLASTKFKLGVPLHRMAANFKNYGFPLKKQTMSDWLLESAERWGKPIIQCLCRDLLKCQVLHADETPLRVLRDKNGDSDQSMSYIWLYRTGKDQEFPIVIYHYCPDRKAENVQKFLQGFAGYLHTDGYQAYHTLPAYIKVVGCWAHARRKFEHAVKQGTCVHESPSIAAQGLTLCNKLFDIEREIQDLPPDQLCEQRRLRAKPVLEALQRLHESQYCIAHEATRKAIKYLRDQWPYLVDYLADGRLEVSNNRAERSIKSFVIDRKNFLFCNTPRGAEASAIWMSLIETAQECKLNPYNYIAWVLSEAPEVAATDENWPEKFLPCKAPESCKLANLL